MATYSEKKAALDGIASRTVNNQDQIKSAYSFVTRAMNDLTSMISEYQSIVDEIDQDVLDNPDDDVIQLMGKEKSKLVSDFVALRDKVIALRDAMGPLL